MLITPCARRQEQWCTMACSQEAILQTKCDQSILSNKIPVQITTDLNWAKSQNIMDYLRHVLNNAGSSTQPGKEGAGRGERGSEGNITLLSLLLLKAISSNQLSRKCT